MNTCPVRVASMAHQFSTIDLLLAVCHQALTNVTMMEGDLLREPNYVRDFGMPTKSRMIAQAINWVEEIFPDMLADELPASYATPFVPGEVGVVWLMRSLLTEYVAQNPELLKIDFRPL